MKNRQRLEAIQQKIFAVREDLSEIKSGRWTNRQRSEADKLRKELLRNERTGRAQTHQ